LVDPVVSALRPQQQSVGDEFLQGLPHLFADVAVLWEPRLQRGFVGVDLFDGEVDGAGGLDESQHYAGNGFFPAVVGVHGRIGVGLGAAVNGESTTSLEKYGHCSSIFDIEDSCLWLLTE